MHDQQPPRDATTERRPSLHGAPSPIRVLQNGRWANARVSLVWWRGERWVVKDFSMRPLLLRAIIGVLLIRRELAAARRTAGLQGMPNPARRIHRYAFMYPYIPGVPLRGIDPQTLPEGFFPKLEALVGAMHRRGLVHLDLRNARNLLVDACGNPCLLDFQSHLSIVNVPRFLRNWMREVDLSGVYKHWQRLDPDGLDPGRRAVFDRIRWRRRWWPFRGYLGIRPRRTRLGGVPESNLTSALRSGYRGRSRFATAEEHDDR